MKISDNSESTLKDNFSKSAQMQGLLSEPPTNGLIRWGTTIIFIIILLLIIASNFIRYPEVIKARLTLISYAPPTSIVARNSGRLILFVKEAQVVNEGMYLGMIENSANSKDILELLKYFEKSQGDLFEGLDRELIRMPENMTVGELQVHYLTFLKILKEYDQFKKSNFYGKQMKILRDEIKYTIELDNRLERQLRIASEELLLAQKRLSVDSSLFAQKVLADLDFDIAKGAFLQSKKNFELALQNITNNKIRKVELESKLAESEITIEEKKSKFKTDVSSSLKQLESQLRDLEQKYLLKAPQRGTVTFFRYRSNNQFINAGEEIMRVIPGSDEMFGEVLVPVVGSGKVEVEQRVNIKLDNYPSTEYGMLIGKIEAISSLPKENMYSIHVKLPNGLVTTYRKSLPYRQEMQGNAEIVTKDLTITERILFQFKSLIDKARISEHSPD